MTEERQSADPPLVALLTADEAEAVAALIDRELPGSRGGPDGLRPLLARDDALALVATRAHVVIGALIAEHRMDRLEVHTLAVASDARRSGVATALLDEAIARSARGGLVGVDLEVGADNKGARALYAKRAFVAVGRRPRYYRGVEDALLLSREFDALEH